MLDSAGGVIGVSTAIFTNTGGQAQMGISGWSVGLDPAAAPCDGPPA